MRYAASYNGQPVGPTLRVLPGDKVSVTLVNDLETSPQDEELLKYIHDENSNVVNATRITNRLSATGEAVR